MAYFGALTEAPMITLMVCDPKAISKYDEKCDWISLKMFKRQ